MLDQDLSITVTLIHSEMGEQYKTLENYKARLAKKVESGEVVCSRCGNKEQFMVNEIGHVFCSKCHTKITFMKLTD